ncbi:MarR family winged helix-turn-helix transcriptional regulator [Glycomyces tarimensis]
MSDAVDDAALTGLGPVSHAIFRVARIHKMFAARLLRETGLFPGQELVMMRLWTEGPQRQVDLARTLGADAPTMTRSIARLERSGFVRRTRSPEDARAMIVEATEDSLPLRAAVERAWSELEALTVGEMTADARSEALAVLGALEHRLLAAERRMSAGG